MSAVHEFRAETEAKRVRMVNQKHVLKCRESVERKTGHYEKKQKKSNKLLPAHNVLRLCWGNLLKRSARHERGKEWEFLRSLPCLMLFWLHQVTLFARALAVESLVGRWELIKQLFTPSPRDRILWFYGDESNFPPEGDALFVLFFLAPAATGTNAMKGWIMPKQLLVDKAYGSTGPVRVYQNSNTARTTRKHAQKQRTAITKFCSYKIYIYSTTFCQHAGVAVIWRIEPSIIKNNNPQHPLPSRFPGRRAAMSRRAEVQVCFFATLRRKKRKKRYVFH